MIQYEFFTKRKYLRYHRIMVMQTIYVTPGKSIWAIIDDKVRLHTGKTIHFGNKLMNFSKSEFIDNL